MKRIALYNLKGGVGKTTASVNLAWQAAREGYRVLLWDLDPQGAASFCFRVRPRLKGGVRELLRRKHPLMEYIRGTDYPNLDLLPTDLRMRKLDLLLGRQRKPWKRLSRLLKPLDKQYDWLIIDCAPSISVTAESLFRIVDAVVAPTVPAQFSINTLEKVRKFLAKHDLKALPVYAFFSMVDRRKRLHREIIERERMAPGKGVTVLDTEIPHSADAERMASERRPIGEIRRDGSAAVAFSMLWSEILARLSAR